jgi:hypothetical protein
MAKHGWRWLESSPLSCIVSGVRESRSAGRSPQEPPNSIVREIHPSKIADVIVARRARVRVAARVGLERRHRMPARCGHCSTCASDQMLRRIIPTAERTVTRGSDKKALTKERRLENGPVLQESLNLVDRIVCFHMSGLLVAAPRRLAKMGSAAQAPTSRNGLVLPLDFTGCLASWIDRSRHLLLVLQTPNPGLASSSPPML